MSPVRQSATKKSVGKSAWHARQNRDPFVAAARRDGYRARSVFKLAEVDGKYHLIKPATRLVDLGAAPGSWSQYAAGKVDNRGCVIAVDLLPMKANTENVNFIHGDFTDDDTVTQIIAAAGDRPLDLVLSDLAPNLSGIKDIDQSRMAQLQQAVIAFCERGLRGGGALLTKLFAGASEAEIRAQIAARFARVQVLKPPASRTESREIYLLANGYQPHDNDA